MSLPWILTNPNLRALKLKNGRWVTAEKIGEQHYLIWCEGTPETEVQCIPLGSGRWYWRGSMAFEYANTRLQAINSGIAARKRGATVDKQPLRPWSEKALAAIAKATGEKA